MRSKQALYKYWLGRWAYVLAALYADIAERHRLVKDQGAVDAKGLFNDLKIRLEAKFELTKDQMVCVYNIHLPDTSVTSAGLRMT